MRRSARAIRPSWPTDLVLGISGFLVAFLLLARAVQSVSPAPEPPLREPSEKRASDSPARAQRETPSFAPPLPAHQPATRYELNAKLDTERNVVEGKGTIHFTNDAQVPVSELWFHLYLNAFKNDRTLFLRSPFGAGRSGRYADEWGYVEVEHLSAKELGTENLWEQAAAHSPGDPEDQTDIRVPLPRAVQPGQKLTLEIRFTSKLPRIVERTGHAGDYYFVAQWFPKLAKLGQDGNFVHFAFHAQSEFHADFSNYEVTLDVPSDHKLGATGRLLGEQRAGARRKLRFFAPWVLDFAWTAWPDFLEEKARFSGVDVRILYPPGHQKNARITRETLRFALRHFESRYGAYPYDVLTVVHPPNEGGDSGGMEYPTLITTGGDWYLGHLGVRAVEVVTVHELGHQWFYGIVASNEDAFPFLDEGLTSYAEMLAMSERFGPGSLLDAPFGLSLSGRAFQRVFAAARGHDDVIAQPARRFASFRSLAALVYSRTATVLDTLGGAFGQARLEEALLLYARRFRFQHPEPDDLLRAIEESMGPAAEAFLRSALFERGWFDFSIRDVQTTPLRDPAGVFDRNGQHETVSRKELSETGTWLGRVLVLRHGTLELPVEIDLFTEDGQRLRHHWDGKGSHHVIDYRGSSPLKGALVDPEERLPLDQNLLNNAASRDPRSAVRTRERLTYLFQLLLSFGAP